MDIWTIGPTAAALGLRSRGFSPSEAARIVALRVRFERDGFREVPLSQKRLEFARWLVDHGRLTEHIDTVETECPIGAEAAASPGERR